MIHTWIRKWFESSKLNLGADMNERIETVLDVVLGFIAAAALLGVLLGVWWLPVVCR